MDGLISAALGVEAFAAATVVLGGACAYAYRQELRATCRLVLGQSSPSPGGNRNAAGAPSDDAEITSDGKEVLVDEVKTAAHIEGAGKPRERRLRVASQNPGAGIHIAKLLEEAETRSEAEELLDIFNDAEIQRNKGSVYAAYAGALLRFGDLIDAGGMLISADRVEGLSEEELEAAMERFLYPKDDGETVEDFADRLRKEGSGQ